MKWLIRSSSVDGKLILHLARKSEPTSWYSVAMTAGIAAQNTQEYNWRKETGLHDFNSLYRARLVVLVGGSSSFNYVGVPTPADVILPRDFVSNLKSHSEIHHPTTPYVT